MPKGASIEVRRAVSRVRRRTAALIRDGEIARKTECEHCGQRRSSIEAHHPDYSDERRVLFLCVPCHIAEHARLRAEGADPIEVFARDRGEAFEVRPRGQHRCSACRVPGHVRSTCPGIAVALTLLTLLLCPAPAQAQPREDVLSLARVCVSEGGFRVSDRECAAIHGVLSRRAARQRMTLSAFARVYSAEAFRETRTDARAYVAHLRADGAEPARWPLYVTRWNGRRGVGRPRIVWHAQWRSYRGLWLARLDSAARILRGEIVDPFLADHWGGMMDDHRAIRAGWLRADDGSTANHFWRVPTRIRGGDPE